MACRIGRWSFWARSLRRECAGLIAVTFLNGAVHAFEAREIEVLDTNGGYRALRDEDIESHIEQEVSPADPLNVTTANPGGLASQGRVWPGLVVSRRANEMALHMRRNGRGRVILPPPVLAPQPALPTMGTYVYSNARRNAEYVQRYNERVNANRRNMMGWGLPPGPMPS